MDAAVAAVIRGLASVTHPSGCILPVPRGPQPAGERPIDVFAVERLAADHAANEGIAVPYLVRDLGRY